MKYIVFVSLGRAASSSSSQLAMLGSSSSRWVPASESEFRAGLGWGGWARGSRRSPCPPGREIMTGPESCRQHPSLDAPPLPYDVGSCTFYRGS